MLRELRRHRICHHFCCWSAPAIPVSEEAAETIWRALNAVSTCRLSCNIQTLFYWGRKGELYTSYHIRLISKYKDLKTKVVSWFSLVIGQNASRQLATSSENLVASAQFLVALATSESQFRALHTCRGFIKHRRSENSPSTTHNSPQLREIKFAIKLSRV